MNENEQKTKRGRPPKKKNESSRLIADEYTEEPLSSLLSKLKELFRQFRTETDITTFERNGQTEAVEIKVRIRLKH